MEWLEEEGHHGKVTEQDAPLVPIIPRSQHQHLTFSSYRLAGGQVGEKPELESLDTAHLALFFFFLTTEAVELREMRQKPHNLRLEGTGS